MNHKYVGIGGVISLAIASHSTLFAAQATKTVKVAQGSKPAQPTQSANSDTPRPAPTPGFTPLMTKSNSVASGMTMGAKYMPTEVINHKNNHPITSLRKDRSDAQFDIGFGTISVKNKIDDIFEATYEASLMHVGLGTAIVTSQGIRFGAHVEIADDPIKYKVKKPKEFSEKTKVSGQDVSFFAAAGVTQNFGIGLDLTMADRKVGDKKESATLVAPAVMGMFDNTEVIFDMIQPNEDVYLTGHWRLAAVQRLNSTIFMTGHLMRERPYTGDDYWNFAFGGRQKYAASSSFGAELLYEQQHDTDKGKCSSPAEFGFKADVDHNFAANQVVSAGTRYSFGSCSYDDTKISTSDLQFKAAFTMGF